MKVMSERKLIAGLRSGDQEAFKQTYEYYKADVLALLVVMLGRQEGVWDLLHDVFISLARRAPNLDSKSNLKGYLLTAAANRARDHLAKRREILADAGTAERIACRICDEPLSIVARKEEAGRLWQAVADLPDEQRVVVALRMCGGSTFKEIAKREGIPENTAQSRYRYALEKLRRQLGRCDHERI